MKKVTDFLFSQVGMSIMMASLGIWFVLMVVASFYTVNGVVGWFKDRQDVPLVEVDVKVERVEEASPSATPIITPTPEPENKPEVSAATTVTGSFDVSVISRINEYRVANGLNALDATPRLNQTAQCRINYLISTGTWSHNNFRACFRTNGVRLHYGENLARQWANSDQAFEAWKQSPTHNANLLNPNWKYVGVITDQGYTVATFSTKL